MPHAFLKHCCCPDCEAIRRRQKGLPPLPPPSTAPLNADDAEFLSLADSRPGPRATAEQLSFIQDLLEQTGESEQEWLAKYEGVKEWEDLDVGEASEVIEALVDIRGYYYRRER